MTSPKDTRVELTPGGQARRAALRPSRAFGVPALLAMVVAQVASGLAARPERFTALIVVLLAVSAVAFAAGEWGLRRAIAAFGAAVLTRYAAGGVGLLTGFPFGEYAFSRWLVRQSAGAP